MIGLLQRVSQAEVAVDGKAIAAIDRGLVVFIGVEAGDGEAQADRLLERLLGYRAFPDAEGKMNLSLRDIGGGRVGAWSRGPGFRGCDGGDARKARRSFNAP